MQSVSKHVEKELTVPLSAEEGAADQSIREISRNQEPIEALSGYELIADMLRRQDDVIAELDALNFRIESTIKEITDTRKLEDQVGSDAVEQNSANASTAAAESLPDRQVA